MGRKYRDVDVLHLSGDLFKGQLGHRHLPFVFPVFFLPFLPCEAARMLSTKLGYLRPALFAERFAVAFFAGDNFFGFLPAAFRGSRFFQGGVCDIL
jgi:hypothetical protein